MNIYTKEEAKIRYTLRPIPPKAHKPCKGGQITAGGERSVTPGTSGTR